MNWITGTEREQTHLLPPCVEDYVGADNPVRFLDAFVGTLDLKGAGFRFPKEDEMGRGRPGYHPGDLLKLYLYGYLNQVRSSRRLEKECHRNLEVKWLLRELAPDFKTIADFRKENAAAFKSVREFTQLCRQLDLFGRQLLAVDGTKMKAVNAADRNWTRARLEKEQARLEEYLKVLDEEDAQEGSVPETGKLQEKIARLKERQARNRERLDTMGDATELSATDPDSRGMKGRPGHVVGYNVQGCVDAKHHLLVVTEAISMAVDQGQLAPVVEAAKKELEIGSADVVADGGYFKSEDIRACQEMGLEPHLPDVGNSPSERAGLYGKKDFQYDPVGDVYRCPNGSRLKRRSRKEDKGRVIFTYENPSACRDCTLKDRCTKTGYRTVSRWEHEESVERMRAAVAAAPGKLAARKGLIEHCWGTLKWMLSGGFLVRGRVRVNAELSLAHFGYNLKRALAVVGLDKLMEALKTFRPGGLSRKTHPSTRSCQGSFTLSLRNTVRLPNLIRSFIRSIPAHC
jgi:transposase